MRHESYLDRIDNDQLGDSIAGTNLNRLFASIDHGKPNLTGVIRINDTDAVRQNETTGTETDRRARKTRLLVLTARRVLRRHLLSSTASWKDETHQTRISQMNGNPHSERFSVTWFQKDRLRYVRPKIHSGRPRRFVFWNRPVRYKNLDINKSVFQELPDHFCCTFCVFSGS